MAIKSQKIIADLAYLHQKQKLETELLALLAMAQEEKTCLLGQLHRLPSRVNGLT